MIIRKPVVAGQFYPSSSADLKKQIKAYTDKKALPTDVIACLLPHAGYAYSGRVAVETVSRINIKNTVILLGPNHTGFGAPFSIMTEGAWQTPLGEVRINSNLAKKILDSSKYLEEDSLAHEHEHSLEVEIPILQYFQSKDSGSASHSQSHQSEGSGSASDFEIVPIAFLSDDKKILEEIGIEIANAIKELNIKDSVLLVASSDMTHYEPQDSALRKDKKAIEAILELDEEKLTDCIERLDISMCGFAPVITMLKVAKALGAKNGKLIKYETSGDVTGDMDSVVGYAGIVIY